jgi:hypothetical protein
MDDCSSHIDNDMVAHLSAVRVSVLVFRLHATQIVPVFYVALFCAAKWHTRYELRIGHEKATLRFRMKVNDELKATILELNMWKAFSALGFAFNRRSEPYRLLFTEEKQKKTAGFRELWRIDFPRNQLSTRPCDAELDWINAPE